MTTKLRISAGAAALAAGLWFLAGAAAAPVLPPGTYKKAAEADIAQLQKSIDHVLKEPSDAKRYGPTIKSMGMILAMYGEATGDKDLMDQALKVAEAAGKKDFKAAGELAGKLAVKPGSAPLKPTGLEKSPKYDLEEVMSPFRGEKVGGLNIDRDLKDYTKSDSPKKLDMAAVELLAARTAVLGEYTVHKPNDKATVNPTNKMMWEKWSKETIDVSKKLAEAAGKGKAANEKEVVKLLQSLNAKCSDCHNKFRDD